MQISEKIRQVLVIQEPPRRIAVAFAVGLFLGMSPLLGVHTILALAVAWLFKLNKFVTLMGVFVTNPWTIVPIYSFGTWLGARIIGMDTVLPSIDWSHITLVSFFEGFRPLVTPFFLGTTVLGLVCAVMSYALIILAIRRRRG